MEKRNELEKMTCKQLMELAKQYGVVGRWDMNKQQLIDGILKKQQEIAPGAKVFEPKPVSFEEAVESQMVRDRQRVRASKDRYEQTAQIGMLVAFYIEKAMYSGKIVEIHDKKFAVETKRGIRYLIDKRSVAWYKTGSRWPRGIYEELTRRDKHVKGEAAAN